jgi:hypothetical protein
VDLLITSKAHDICDTAYGGTIDRNSLAYAAAVVAAYRCHTSFLCASAVTHPPNHQAWEIIHQPSRFHFDTLGFKFFTQSIPDGRILHHLITRRDNSVVDNRFRKSPFLSAYLATLAIVARVVASGLAVSTVEATD